MVQKLYHIFSVYMVSLQYEYLHNDDDDRHVHKPSLVKYLRRVPLPDDSFYVSGDL